MAVAVLGNLATRRRAGDARNAIRLVVLAIRIVLLAVIIHLRCERRAGGDAGGDCGFPPAP